MSKPKRTKSQSSIALPPLPSLLTKPLGLEGWTRYEPVLLAALATGDPLLLVGSHGTAKSFFLERLAQALELEYRFYNASLINYDDLVGIPIPSEDKKELRYISHPSAIWGAEVVFFDEINRTRPELQNKLFPIVHEKRVQGIPLEKLKYRWSAMNPTFTGDLDDSHNEFYLGTEPLDTALADRFCFIIEVPGWQQLTDSEKRRIFQDQFIGSHGFPVPLSELVYRAEQHFQDLQKVAPKSLEDYLLNVIAQLETNGILLSIRRATALFRNILSIHAARITLYESSFPDEKAQLANWSTSALLALQTGLPHIAQGQRVDQASLLAAHRHAWEVSRLDDDNPWRILLQIKDPLKRCIAGIRLGQRISDQDLSSLVLDALGAEEDGNLRIAAALPIYVALNRSRDLNATVFETLAQDLRNVLRPATVEHDPYDCSRQRYRQVEKLCKELKDDSGQNGSKRNEFAHNLLQGLIPGGFETVTPYQVLKTFNKVWEEIVEVDSTTIN